MLFHIDLHAECTDLARGTQNQAYRCSCVGTVIADTTTFYIDILLSLDVPKTKHPDKLEHSLSSTHGQPEDTNYR